MSSISQIGKLDGKLLLNKKMGFKVLICPPFVKMNPESRILKAAAAYHDLMLYNYLVDMPTLVYLNVYHSFISFSECS